MIKQKYKQIIIRILIFLKNSKNDYNMRIIDDILKNESTHLLGEFKDYLIMNNIIKF